MVHQVGFRIFRKSQNLLVFFFQHSSLPPFYQLSFFATWRKEQLKIFIKLNPLDWIGFEICSFWEHLGFFYPGEGEGRTFWRLSHSQGAHQSVSWRSFFLLKINQVKLRSTPHPVTVTTRIITFLVGNPYKPSFATVTGWGVDPKSSHAAFHPKCLPANKSWGLFLRDVLRAFPQFGLFFWEEKTCPVASPTCYKWSDNLYSQK